VDVYKSIHVLLIIINVGVFFLQYIPSLRGYEPPFDSESGLLVVLEVVIYFLGAVQIFYSFNEKKWIKLYRDKRLGNKTKFATYHLIRIALIELVVAYSMGLLFLGSRWFMILVFIVLASIGLIRTFPTKKRLEKYYHQL